MMMMIMMMILTIARRRARNAGKNTQGSGCEEEQQIRSE
jgi:hypothetical protein